MGCCQSGILHWTKINAILLFYTCDVVNVQKTTKKEILKLTELSMINSGLLKAI